MVRMVLSQMLPEDGPGLLSQDFLQALARINTEEEMVDFVDKVFRPLVKAPNSQPNVRLPKFSRAFEATTFFSGYLTEHAKLIEADILTDMEALFHNTIKSEKVAVGANKLMISIILAVSTTPQTAISTFPLLASLGSVTLRLKETCHWDEALMEKISELALPKTDRINDPGMFQAFFNKIETFKPSTSENIVGKSTISRPAKYLASYYRLMMADLSESTIQDEYWVTEVTKEELDMVGKLFNKPDSDAAIIACHLVELDSSTMATVTKSYFNVDGMTDPSLRIGHSDTFKKLENFLSMSSDQQNIEMKETMDAPNAMMDLAFFELTAPKSALFRVNTDNCLFFDHKKRNFCQNLAEGKTARCHQHQNTANTKFMEILARLNDDTISHGFSLCSAAFRFVAEPQVSSGKKEFAPSLEGSEAQWYASATSLKKLLYAGFKSYSAGYNSSTSKPFNDNFYRDEFPDATDVTKERWNHAFLATRVSLTF